MNDITMIQAKNVYYYYKAMSENAENVEAINGIDLEIKKGEFLVLLGRNGSGKSTLCRLFNALLKPRTGTVFRQRNGYLERRKYVADPKRRRYGVPKPGQPNRRQCGGRRRGIRTGEFRGSA